MRALRAFLLDWARENRVALAFAIAAVLVRVAFWLYTGRTWEDALITAKHARNAAAGLGLVHHLGEGRVHGFTSALSVLIPLVGELAHEGWGIPSIKLASLVASFATIGVADALARSLGIGRARFFALAYLAFDVNQVFYGAAGMETQLAVLVLLASALLVKLERGLASGVALGLALLARPDFALLVGPAVLYLLGRSRREGLRACGALGVVVLPWVLFTTLYYGSPVPHTILAKAGTNVFSPQLGKDSLATFVGWSWFRVYYHRNDWYYFAPFLGDGFVIGAPLPLGVLFATALSFLGLGVAGAYRMKRALVVGVVYVALFSAYRVLLLPHTYNEWYLPPFFALWAILASAALDALARKTPRVAAALGIALALLYAFPLPFSFVVEERIQHRAEEPVRDQLSRWLAANVKDGEPLVSESAGYVAWRSNLLLWDFPGLTSPRVRETLARQPRRNEARNIQTTIALLDPTWCVLRPLEIETLERLFPQVAARYAPVQRFVVPEDPHLAWGGYAKMSIDLEFFVLRRRR